LCVTIMSPFFAFVNIFTISGITFQLISFETRASNGTQFRSGIVAVMSARRRTRITYTDRRA
jgi:hypothetical protein